jgi:glycosyltransferase involved in cell wall biosynthesis
MLAIIIPYYKLTFFEETLDSLAAQTDQRFKVYIGDDASPESPTVLLKKYKGKFDFEFHRFEENLGGVSLTQQWERCIALSSNEEWIMILGDDDVLGFNVVDCFYSNFKEFNTKFNVVRFATQIHYINNESFSKIFTHPVNEFYKDTYFKKLHGTSRSSLSEYIFKKTIYQKHGFHNYPLAWNSDDRAWFEFSEDRPIFSINSATITITISNRSISGLCENQFFKDKSVSMFYRFLIFGRFLSLKEKNTIANLYIRQPKKNINFLVRLYIYLLKKYCTIKR